LEIVQRRIASTKIIQCQLHAALLQLMQMLEQLWVQVFQQQGLGQLQAEAGGIDTRTGQTPLQQLEEMRLMDLACADVDVQRPVPAARFPLPLGQLRAGGVEYPLPDSDNQAIVLGQRDETVWWQQAELRVLPAQQGLHTDDALLGVDQWLIVQA